MTKESGLNNKSRDEIEQSGPFFDAAQAKSPIETIASVTYGGEGDDTIKAQALNGFATAYACPETQVIFDAAAAYIKNNPAFRVYTGLNYHNQSHGFYNDETQVVFLEAVTPEREYERVEPKLRVLLESNSGSLSFPQNIVHEFGHMAADVTFRHLGRMLPSLKEKFQEVAQEDKKNFPACKLGKDSASRNLNSNIYNVIITRNLPLYYHEKYRLREHIARIGESFFIADYFDRKNGDTNRTLFKYCTEELLPRSYAFYQEHMVPAYKHYIEIADKIPAIKKIAQKVEMEFLNVLEDRAIVTSIDDRLNKFARRVCNAVERGLINNLSMKELETIVQDPVQTDKLVKHLSNYWKIGLDELNPKNLEDILEKGKSREEKVKLITSIPELITTWNMIAEINKTTETIERPKFIQDALDRANPSNPSAEIAKGRGGD
ncbi:MAG: hypothetical protein K0R63_1135 [Rickettsiales bacterium]|jgi:hypothetical protein|nr:hypothetical protein [Rickettsiales bacterium]